MMKRILPLVFFFVALAVQADLRSEAELRSLAYDALTNAGSTRLKVKAQTSPLQTLMEKSQLIVLGYEEAGWAMISKDDAFNAVLAYSDTPMDMTDPAPGFVALMEHLNANLESQLLQPASSRAKARQKVCSTLRAVSPLLKTAWAQGYPYNSKCPKVHVAKDGKEYDSDVVCGCVATAFAQTFYYHQLPKKMHGSKTYTWANKVGVEAGTDTAHRLSYDFGNNPFDWDNIKAVYNGSESTTQIGALGDLIYACGVMASMNYTPGESGASVYTMAACINAYTEDVRATMHGMDLTVIARELNDARPVVYAGSDKDNKGGHCFIIDGADSKGYLHLDMGWAGSGNGYYATDNMNGWANSPYICTVEPFDNTTAAAPTEDLQGKICTVDAEHPVSELQPNVWYMMWNVGRNYAVRDNGRDYNVGGMGYIPENQRTEFVGSALVRLIPNNTGAKYYIQTGRGNFLPSFAQNTPAKPTQNKTAAYAISPITDDQGVLHEDVFYLLNSSNVRLDGNDSYLVGWNTGETHEVNGNCSWKFYPVTLTDAAIDVKVEDVVFPIDTLRMMPGATLRLVPEVLPANATLPYLDWSSSLASCATVSAYGEVTAVAKGKVLLTAKAVDGSDISKKCVVMVGSATQTKKVANLRDTYIYTLRNEGYTNAYLLASDTTTLYPQVRGIERTTSSLACKNKEFWDDAIVGDAYTLWQFVKDYEDRLYLYNVGMRKFLVNGGNENTEYVFSEKPAPVEVTAVAEEDFTGASAFTSCFYLNAGAEDGSRLTVNTGFFNAAHWLAGTTDTQKKCSVWRIDAISNLNTGLELLTADALNAMIYPEGVATASVKRENSSLTYDLQGRISANQNAGVLIQNGKKIIR